MNIKKGDKVKVLSGKDRGKVEKVVRVDHSTRRLIVENVMVVKRHTKRTQKIQGGIIEKPQSIDISKVMVVCPVCSTATRVGKKREGATTELVRYCKHCNESIDKG